jgi:hypothetical protein
MKITPYNVPWLVAIVGVVGALLAVLFGAWAAVLLAIGAGIVLGELVGREVAKEEQAASGGGGEGVSDGTRKPIALIFPDRLRIEVRPAGEGKVEMEYVEWYPEVPDEVITSTLEAFKMMVSKLPLRMEAEIHHNPEDRSIKLLVRGPREAVYGALAMEFLAHSVLGRLTMAELLALAVAA